MCKKSCLLEKKSTDYKTLALASVKITHYTKESQNTFSNKKNHRQR